MESVVASTRSRYISSFRSSSAFFSFRSVVLCSWDKLFFMLLQGKVSSYKSLHVYLHKDHNCQEMRYYHSEKIEGGLVRGEVSRLLSNAEPLITLPAARNCRHKKTESLWLSLLPVYFLLTLISSISLF